MTINFNKGKDLVTSKKNREAVAQAFSDINEENVLIAAIINQTGNTTVNGIDYTFQQSSLNEELQKASQNLESLKTLK